MIPREHGAYAELLFPMAAVLIGGSPTISAWLLCVAAVACFVANEPLLVLSGSRGSRARREHGAGARTMLGIMMLLATVCGLLSLWYAPPAATVAALLPVSLGGVLVWLASTGRERRLFGEVTAAAALSAVAVPLGLMSGLSVGAATSVALIWWAVALLGTAVVRLTVAGTRAKSDDEALRVRSKWALLFLLCLILVAIGVAAPFAPRGALWVLAAALPVACAALAFAIAKPSARHLRRIGWGLVLANTCTLIAVVVALRLIADYVAIKSTLPFPMF